MIIARVGESIVATRKDASLVGLSLRVVVETTADGQETGRQLVAADPLGAAAGQTVIVVQGSSAKTAEGMGARAVDAVIVGIVDEIEVPA
jgi:ethanolamine utilization protein EutN